MKVKVLRFAALLAACAVPAVALAQAYPARTVRTIMTLSGGADVIARIVAQRMTESLGQPFVVDMVLGASGAIGAETAARAAPDGYTIVLTSSAQIVTRGFLTRNTPYDPVKSFTPIGTVAEAILVVIANPAFPANSMKELVEYAKKNPGKVSHGTSGIGTSHHLSAEMVGQLTGIQWTHVPYKGGSPVIVDTISGQVPVAFAIYATAVQAANAGKLKILALNGDTRYHVIPDVPTIREQLPGYQRPPGWMAYFGPAGLPAPIVARLNAEIVKTMEVPEIRAKSEAIGFVPVTGPPEQLAETVRRDLAVTAKIVKSAGIQPE